MIILFNKKNDKLLAYIDPSMAVLGSFTFEKDELSKKFTGKEIKIPAKKVVTFKVGSKLKEAAEGKKAAAPKKAAKK